MNCIFFCFWKCNIPSPFNSISICFIYYFSYFKWKINIMKKRKRKRNMLLKFVMRGTNWRIIVIKKMINIFSSFKKCFSPFSLTWWIQFHIYLFYFIVIIVIVIFLFLMLIRRKKFLTEIYHEENQLEDKWNQKNDQYFHLIIEIHWIDVVNNIFLIVHQIRKRKKKN